MAEKQWKRRGRLAAAKPILAITAVAATIGIAACGDSSDETSTEAEASVTPAMAIDEIGAVEDGLAASVAAYQKGDADQAESSSATPTSSTSSSSSRRSRRPTRSSTRSWRC